MKYRVEDLSGWLLDAESLGIAETGFRK